MLIREEKPEDLTAIHHINAAGFYAEAEANQVDALRMEGAVIASLVAEEDGRIVGHILFSP